MSESILSTTKLMLGIAPEYTHFDPIIIPHINTALMILNQMGVGPEEPMMITDASTTWESFLGSKADINAVKTWVGLKVRLLFDPPQNSAHINAINENLKELEWRLYSAKSSKNFDYKSPDWPWAEYNDLLEEG